MRSCTAYVAAIANMLCVYLCGVPTRAHAQTTPVYAQGTRASGMGEAFNALSSGTSGVYHNPAGIARALMYAIDASFNYTPNGSVVGAAIVDSKTNPAISAGIGVGYYISTRDGTNDNALDVRFLLAIPAVPERISFGIGGRYLNVKSDDIETMAGFTLDAGALFRLVDELHVGISAKNLLDPCQKQVCEGYVPMTIGGGVAYSTRDLSISADLDFDMTSGSSPNLHFGLGAEYLIQQVVPIRLGFLRHGTSATNMLTMGTGWRSPSAGIDLSYQHDLSRNTLGLVSLSVSAFF